MAVYIAVPLTATSDALNNVVETCIPATDRYQLQKNNGRGPGDMWEWLKTRLK